MDFNNLIHQGIMDDDRWIKMPIGKQIGNIGAEVSRIINAKNKGYKDRERAAFERALELIDLTIYGFQKNNEASKLREIVRFREVFCDYVIGSGIYGESGERLLNYCTQFALMRTE